MSLTVKATRSEIVYICFFFLYVLIQCLTQTEFVSEVGLYYRAGALCVLLLLIKVLNDRYISTINIFWWCVLLLMSLLITYNSRNYRIVIAIAFFMFAANNVRPKLLIKTSFIAVSIVWCITVLSAFMGLIPFNYITDGERIRYCMGFGYISFPANFLIHALLMWIFIRGKRPKWFEIILILFLNFFVFYYSRTRMVFYTILMITFLWTIMHKINLKSMISKIFFGLSFVWCAISSIGLQYFFTPSKPWMLLLNSLFSSRLALGREAINRYGFSMFGQYIEWNTTVSSEYFYVDSSFLNIALNYGVVLLILLVVGFTILMFRNIKSGDRYLVLALFGIAFHAITDPQLFSLTYDPFICLLAALIPITSNSYEKLLAKKKARDVSIGQNQLQSSSVI